jgi:hypothetical protein
MRARSRGQKSAPLSDQTKRCYRFTKDRQADRRVRQQARWLGYRESRGGTPWQARCYCRQSSFNRRTNASVECVSGQIDREIDSRRRHRKRKRKAVGRPMVQYRYTHRHTHIHSLYTTYAPFIMTQPIVSVQHNRIALPTKTRQDQPRPARTW